MDRQQQIAEARKVDTFIAEKYNEYFAVVERISTIRKAIKDSNKSLSWTRHPGAKESIERRIAGYEEQITALEAERQLKSDAYLEAEKLYKGWSRFFLVQHIHSNTHCSSFRPTTRIGWLPNVSGLTEAEAVKEHGATLCTICFPSAPVELTTKAADPETCTGSGSFVNRELPNRLGFYSGNWGTCPDCGERVTVVGSSGVKLRKHKNPNF